MVAPQQIDEARLRKLIDDYRSGDSDGDELTIVLYDIARRSLGRQRSIDSSLDREDYIQEAVLALLLACETIDLDQRPVPFLVTVARHHYFRIRRDLLRACRRPPAAPVPLATSVAPGIRLSETVSSCRRLATLTVLAPQRRARLTAAAAEFARQKVEGGWTHQQVAEHLGCSRSAISRILRRPEPDA